MRDSGTLQQELVEYLKTCGVEAVTAWSGERRLRAGQVVAAVSVRRIERGPAGFQDYLGERYDPESGQWRERYGRRLELTFGVDVSAASAQQVQAGVDSVQAALDQGGPEGLRPVELSAGECVYDTQAGRYLCPVQVRFLTWAVAETGEGETFLDFEVRGERKA